MRNQVRPRTRPTIWGLAIRSWLALAVPWLAVSLYALLAEGAAEPLVGGGLAMVALAVAVLLLGPGDAWQMREPS